LVNVYFAASHTDDWGKIKDKTSKLTNDIRSLLAARTYGLTVAMATIKAELHWMGIISVVGASIFDL